MTQIKPEGPVVVIGGGIAGIQAALNLSLAGYGVHLVERADSLGGRMPSLHRIYPLCACCKLDPRISACEEDPNINVMLGTTVTDISGEEGNFVVDLEEKGERKSVQAGAVILAGGLETFEPTKYETYSYGRFPNVVTSVEYEQLQKPTGPNKGVLKRPSDGRTPERVAWLQCVGSRDINRCDAPYCSSVCCMHALKETLTTKDFSEEIETTIFYMDMRTHGKGYEDYLNDAIARGVRLVRSRIHSIESLPESDDLVIAFADEKGNIHKESFNMVVLSVGLRPSSDAVQLCEKAGVKLNEDRYVDALPFKAVSTSVPGIFVCGALNGPYDISQSVIQATAAVSEVASFLKPARLAEPPAYPAPATAEDEDPKVLLAYHLCSGSAPELGTQIQEAASVVPGLSEAAQVEGNIVNFLTDKLKQSGANRLVFASCTPVIHKNAVEEALKRAGLNPYLYETVDLRMIAPEAAREQVKDRIRMGAARASLISPPSLRQVPVAKRALVVGGGPSGLEAALAVAKEGYPVTLVEKSDRLGGNGLHIKDTWQGYDAQQYLDGLIASVEGNESITVMTNASLKGSKGFAGHFTSTAAQNGRAVEISHGVSVLATGASPIQTDEYLYGRHPQVYSWLDLSRKMLEDPSAFTKANTAVFIQCVGSREPQRPHCSNLCCSFAARSAVDFKTANPEMDVFILFREMRTFGEKENLYREARQKGVVFIRYDLENKPVVESEGEGGPLKVTVHDHILDRPVVLTPDFISLQTAIVGAGNQELADIFKINLDRNGFLAESPQKLRPLDASVEGVYLAGLAHYPKDLGESILQAKGAAARALEILRQDVVQVGGAVAEVRSEKCAECCTCVRTCPFQVPFIDREKGAAYIDPGLCQGCGMCVAECPAKAIVMSTCSDRMLTEAPVILLNG